MEDKPFGSSSFKPKLNDQDYMELVCENGQILAKSRRSKNSGFFQNQLTQSLLDLYETEYDEGFKNNIKNLGDTQVVPVSESQRQQTFERCVPNSDKRVRSSTLIDDSAKNAPPDEQSVAVGRSTELFFASSTDLSCRSFKRKYEDIEEEEESTYLSNNSDDDDESDDAKTQVLARTRKTVTKRKQRDEINKKINKKMRALQDLLPNCYKEDKASLLDEAIKYMRTLQLQVQMMSMGNGVIRPPTMLPLMSHYAATMPQFLPMNVHGNGFQGFLNHSTGLIPNSPIFHPLEHNSHQYFMRPSCVPQTQTQTQTQATTSFTQFPKSASTSNLEDAMQFRGRNGF